MQMLDMIGRVGVEVGVLWDCWGEWGWRVNGWIRLHLRIQTLSISKFKLNNIVVKLISRISKYNFYAMVNSSNI